MLIVFEGPSRSGKSTTMAAVAERLRSRNLRVRELIHPGVLDRELQPIALELAQVIDPLERLLLYATRTCSNAGVVQRALAEDADQILLLDRFLLSLMVLCHHVHGLPRDTVEIVSLLAGRDITVTATVFFDADYDEYIRRGGQLEPIIYDRFRAGFHEEFRCHDGPKHNLEFHRQETPDNVNEVLSFLDEEIF